MLVDRIVGRKDLESLIGKCGWISCLLKNSKRRLRSFYELFWHKHFSKRRKTVFNNHKNPFVRDLLWWRKVIKNRFMWKMSSDPKFLVVTCADASTHDVGGYCNVNGKWFSENVPEHLKYETKNCIH